MRAHLAPLLAAVTLTLSQAAEPIDAFPAAEDGMVRFVITLPERDDADRVRVELIPGKTVTTDAVNRYSLTGQLGSKTVEGMGYTYYLLPKFGPMTGTLMAPPPDAAEVERFVRLRGEPFLVRYNPKLPIVVYLPEGAELRYRLWETGEEIETAEQR